MMKLITIYAITLLLLAVAAVGTTTTFVTYKAGMRIHPFHEIQQSSFAWLEGATVAIEFGYVPEMDRLFFDYEGSFNISATFNTQNGVLYLSGKATATEYTNAIASVAFFTASRDGQPRRITWSFGKNTFYFSLTNHFYWYVQKPSSWQSAKSTCANTQFFGLNGYLATSTTADEQGQLSAMATFSAWLGGNDVGHYGNYSWVVGPEVNNSYFWNGPSQYAGGYAPQGQYSAWNRFQPLNVEGSGTDYMYLVNSADQATSYWAVAKATDPIDGYICEFGAPGEDPTRTMLSGSVQVVLGCRNFVSITDCQNHADFGCAWQQGTCVSASCQGMYRDQTKCEADWKCMWNTDGPVGVCTNTPCSIYGGPETCLTDPLCTVHYGGATTCKPAVCSDRLTACSCNQLPGCSWRGNICGSDQTLNCNNTDIVVAFDGSSIMAAEYGRFTQGFAGLIRVLIDTQFSLTNTLRSQTNLTSGTTGQRVGFIQFANRTYVVNPSLSGNRTEVISELQAQARYQLNTDGLVIASALQKAKSMFTDATRNRIVVIIAAGGIADAQALAKQYSQRTGVLADLMASGIKIMGISLNAAAAETDDGLAARQSLQYLTNIPVISSVLRDIPKAFYGMCQLGPRTPQSAAILPTNVTNELCVSYTDRNTCVKDPRCAWDFAVSVCSNSGCMNNCEESKCSTACVWQSNQCIQLCPTLNDTQCELQDYGAQCSFHFVDEICENLACVSNPNEDACVADPAGCQWNPNQQIPCQLQVCNTGNQDACTSIPQCSWNGAECFFDVCKQQTTQTGCSALAQCGWNSASSACSANVCGQYIHERECSIDFQCMWNVGQSPAACTPAPCTFYNTNPATAQMLCQLNSKNCVWSTFDDNGKKDMCLPRMCDLMRRSCDCAAVDGCVWRNNTCKDDPFVQCPATDVVFLIEATPVMSEDFGRHPNGFVGIVEVIRSWAETAPFSPALSSTGFRVAAVGYGQTGRSLSVLTGGSVGGGGNLTGILDQFIGPQQELDYLEGAEAAYATAGQSGSASIKKGLEKAISIFQNSPNPSPPRNRILVVIGNSPITDQTLSGDITNLELMGVRIFANIVRRFQFVTPNDLMAANFMRPLASDPPSEFFMFTTIDGMQQALLEKFCDPTTGTGKVLKISRNGELPCSWLRDMNECTMQGSCAWDPFAAVECPNVGECPNLNCMSLPPALAAQNYECKHCELSSGDQIDCSFSVVNTIPVGACVKSNCATKCLEAPGSLCSATAGCAPVTESTRCERDMCAVYTNAPQCNGNFSCVWVMSNVLGTDGKGTCQKSICSRFRDQFSCDGATITEELREGVETPYSPCMYNTTTTPALCIQQRCPQLQQGLCSANSQTCNYVSSLPGRKCETKLCQHSEIALCEFDPLCYWNSFTQTCHKQVTECVLSGYSDWAPCSSSCGQAATWKSRAIVQFPAPGGTSCKDVAARGCVSGVTNCDSKNYEPGTTTVGDMSVTIVRTCVSPPEPTQQWLPSFPQLPKGDWPMNCTIHCSGITDRQTCILDSACRWIGNVKCIAKQFSGCQTLQQAACALTDMCGWDENRQLCEAKMDVCPYTTKTDCNSVFNCAWRDGTNTIKLATAQNLPVQLVNPGQDAIYPFEALEATDPSAYTDVIYGATVTIEGNYQRGKDELRSLQTQIVKSQWLEQSGTLLLSGNATAAEYIQAIRFITFRTTSTRTTHRTLTWAFGVETMYGSTTGHLYQYVEQVGVFYSAAVQSCSQLHLHGMQGYLATVTSGSENDLISTKLFAAGWVSGSDATNGIWQFTSGNTSEMKVQFWKGPSALLGGTSIKGQFVNWSPPNQTNPSGEPLVNQDSNGAQGVDRLYLSRSGYWESRAFDNENVEGFVCEFGGMPADTKPLYPIGGAMVIGVGGCVALPCIFHQQQSDCQRDSECGWNNGECEQGCGARSTESECISSSRCKWDTSSLPASCILDICQPLSVAACAAAPECTWDPSGQGQCAFKKGCGQYSKDTCDDFPQCSWATTICVEKACSSFNSPTDCRTQPLCQWITESSSCVDSFCQFQAEVLCNQNSDKCVWNQPATLSIGFQPGGEYVYPFAGNLPIPGDSSSLIDGVTVSIQYGFQVEEDVLDIDPTMNFELNWVGAYNSKTGVLRLILAPGVQMTVWGAFTFMKSAVRFSSLSTANIKRQISYVLSLNTVYSTSTKTFYKWLPAPRPTSFADAQNICANLKMTNLTGSLAILAVEPDNLAVRVLQPSGWIAAYTTSDGQWSWSVPNQSPLPFWAGMGSLGFPLDTPKTPNPLLDVNGTVLSDKMYAQWALGEPSLASGYGYVTPKGFWKSIPGSSKLPGVVCQFGSSVNPPNSSVSGVRNVIPQGCFPAKCLTLPQSVCTTTLSCRWNSARNTCVLDSRCIQGKNPDQCKMYQSCYWDYGLMQCMSEVQNVCSVNYYPINCTQTKGCAWNPSLLPTLPGMGMGACVFTGCAVHPELSACQADPLCKWAGSEGPCVERLCGYLTPDTCWRDPQCVWGSSDSCKPSPCVRVTSQAACTATDSCSWDTTTSKCQYQRCSTTKGIETCLVDIGCIFLGGKCVKPSCNPTSSQKVCNSNPQCFFFAGPKTCGAAQCVSYNSLAACEQGETVTAKKPCIWNADTESCRQPSFVEQNAPPRTNACARQTNPNMWWLWLFLVVILILLGIIVYRLYLAHASGASFFEPTRKNFKYNPHEQFAAELFDEAKVRGEETNF